MGGYQKRFGEKRMKERWLVTGSRKKYSTRYKSKVFDILTRTLVAHRKQLGKSWKPECILHGNCSNSADEYADMWAKFYGIKVERHPASKGNYLKRNINMVKSDISEVFAFWDGFSYGTAHTISHSILQGLPVTIIKI